MTEDDVYKELFKPAAKKDVIAFIEQFKILAEQGVDTAKAGDMMAYCAAEIVLNLSNAEETEKALPVVTAYLKYSDSIPASVKRKQYFASFAAACIEFKTELADDFENKLLTDDYIDTGYGLNISACFCRMNLYDKVNRHVAKTMEAGGTRDDILRNTALSKHYGSSAEFKGLVDNLEDVRLEAAAIFDKEPDPDNFEEIIAAAKAELTRDYYNSRTNRVIDPVKFNCKEHRSQVEEFLKTGFQTLKVTAAKKDRLINSVLYDALARAIAVWQNSGFSDLLMSEFSYVTAGRKEITDGLSRHYELNLVSGKIALALAAIGYKGDTAAFESFLKSFEWRYPGDDFVMQVRYAKWMIEKDSAGAIEYINNSENKKGLAYAVCALTDLNHKEVLPVLSDLLLLKLNPVFTEVLKESISRLSMQKGMPEWKERMIHLFGVMTSAEKALGGENDNVFAERASKAAGDNEIGVTYEADDSAADDR